VALLISEATPLISKMGLPVGKGAKKLRNWRFPLELSVAESAAV
jgi:hypothetical protein